MGANKECIAVLDVGKTLAKVTLWSPTGELLGRKTRLNARQTAPAGYPMLDVAGTEGLFAETLAEFAKQETIGTIVPVAHGASGVVLEEGGGYIEPIDYEAPLPDDLWASYLAQRDPFSETGSPSLPGGLNFGSQLHWLEAILPERFARGTIVSYPQFWAWRLCGVPAIEVTSLGTHTDLWCPSEGRPSHMAQRRGWAKKFAPLRQASDVLGTVSKAWQDRCGLPAHCRIVSGVHDSNADLLAVRAHPLIGNKEFTVISTGTWFISMRSSPSKPDLKALPEARDCLVNVNAFGIPVPSSRFMGGRETEILEAAEKSQLDPAAHADELLQRAAQYVQDGVMALPAFQKGVGPFPDRDGRWIGKPADQIGRRAVAGLYLALMADTSLGLIGAQERLVVEGRFIADPVFAQALARLRPDQKVYLAPSSNSLCQGAISLVAPEQVPESELVEVQPLPFALDGYAAKWREQLSVADHK
jgi:sugar (pentulose or hexulose) kinase